MRILVSLIGAALAFCLSLPSRAADVDVGVSAATATPDADDPASYLPSRVGAVGLYEMSTAEVGPPAHLRIGLHGEYFTTDDFLVQGDHDTQMGTALVLGFTPLRYLEVFAGVTNTSNRNERSSEAGRGDPEVIKSWGDLRLGSKLAGPVSTATSAGFEVGLRFPPPASQFSIAPRATSLWLGPLASLDFRRINGVALRFHANVGYYLDNSKNVSDFSSTTLMTRRVSMFAYNIAASRFRVAVGADAPLERLTPAVPLQPFAEYHAEIVTDDADPAYADVMGPGGRDRQWLAFGLRARVYRGITLDAGTDIRLRSTAAKYGPPLPPYDVVLGASYPLDIDAFRRPVVVTKTVEKEVIKEVAPAPSSGEITGTVSDTKDGKPLGGAIVALKGRPHARVATDDDGSFALAGVPPGPAAIEVWAPSFDAEKVTAAVAPGRTAHVTVALSRRIETGVVRGKVTDTVGHPVEASLHFSGAQAFDARSDSQGLFQATLTPGPYRLAVDAPALASKQAVFDLAAGQEQQLDLGLRAPNADVTLSGETITLRQPIKLRAGTPRLAPRDQGELDGVAALLDDHPEIRMLRVEAHWDASAGITAKTLTQEQAQAIKDYLVKKGISERRIDAVGMGSEQPLIPSIGPGNRSKNRRIELRVTY